MGKVKQAWEGLKTKKELKLMDGESRALYELTTRLMQSEHLTYEQVWECYD